jgi:hypothetical protein
LTNGDTLASLNITCATTFTAGGLPGTYPTSCLATTNPNNAYAITYVGGTLTVTAATATMISPAPGSTLPIRPVAGSTRVSSGTFTWTQWPGTAGYYIQVSASPGTASYGTIQTSGSVMTATFNNILINGSPLYVRLGTRINNTWQYLDYVYTAPTPIKAAMIPPVPGSIVHGGTATFTWNPGYGVAAYYVQVGSSLGNPNFGSAQTIGTSLTWSNLPTNNSTIYVRLSSRINNAWVWTDYTYTAAP